MVFLRTVRMLSASCLGPYRFTFPPIEKPLFQTFIHGWEDDCQPPPNALYRAMRSNVCAVRLCAGRPSLYLSSSHVSRISTPWLNRETLRRHQSRTTGCEGRGGSPT